MVIMTDSNEVDPDTKFYAIDAVCWNDGPELTLLVTDLQMQ